MKNKLDTKKLTAKQKLEIEKNAPPSGHWGVIEVSDIPSIITEGFATKIQQIVAVASSCSNGKVIVMLNLHRYDYKSECIDQQPLIAIITTGGIGDYATYIQHGNWPGRSYDPGPTYWGDIKQSFSGKQLPNIPPGVITAPLEDMSEGDRLTFEAVLSIITDSDEHSG